MDIYLLVTLVIVQIVKDRLLLCNYSDQDGVKKKNKCDKFSKILLL